MTSGAATAGGHADDGTPTLLERARSLVPHLDELFAALVLALAFVATFQRLSYGVDPADEAFALAITQRYSLGDRPYIDEFNLRQSAGLLTAPVYWLYMKLAPSGTDGIVYFMRVMYLCVQSLVAWSVFELAVRRVPRSFALLATAMPLTYIPFGMPVCNYNALGALLLTLGAFTGLRALLDEPRRSTMIWAGVANALACIAYAPMAVPVTIFAAVVAFLPEKRAGARGRWPRFLDFMIGVAIVGIPFLFILVPGIPGIKKALEYEAMTTRARTLDKVKGVIRSVALFSPAAPSTLTTLGVAGLIAARAPSLRKYVFGLVLLVVVYTFCEVQPETRSQIPAHCLTLHIAIYVGLLGGFFAIFVARGVAQTTMLLAGWLPSVIAGLISATASDNIGCMNGGIGLFSASVLAMVLMPMAIEAPPAAPTTPATAESAAPRLVSSGETLNWVERLGVVVVMATVPLTSLSVNAAHTYSDGPIVPDMPRVHVGPFKGLRGTPQKVERVEELTRELRTMVRPGDVMLSYYDFPGAYLITPSKPGLQTVWTDRRAKLGPMLPYWEKRRTGQGIVLVIAGASGVSPELESLVEVPERLLKDKGWFRVYREPPPP